MAVLNILEVKLEVVEKPYTEAASSCFSCYQKVGKGPTYIDDCISLLGLAAIQKFMVISSTESLKVAERSPFKILRELELSWATRPSWSQNLVVVTSWSD
ncbi:hypothetical protein PoB_005390800 [Plakobranchus ocellatus]|uniref:Uncharacterized protein n=1 Tax=Plakobranchus ocellatus TaxID=259542 RepID=A0AAV4C8S3_9GAST|nr:hypothetical protein PoB_005390800 [Plakobranchus ocellatus]